MLQGHLTLTRDGVAMTYGPGDGFAEVPGQTLQAVNSGSSDVVLVATFLVPDGAQLTTNV